MELVLLVFIVVAVFSLIPPWILRRRNESRKQHAAQQLRTMGQALSTYQEIYRSLPLEHRPPTNERQR